MRNTRSPDRDEEAARTYAAFDNADPFAYARVLAHLRRGCCALGSAEEIIKDYGKRGRQ